LPPRPDGGLKQVGALGAHQSVELLGNCPFGGVLAENVARDRNYDDQNGPSEVAL
jgi:hypothetical protein